MWLPRNFADSATREKKMDRGVTRNFSPSSSPVFCLAPKMYLHQLAQISVLSQLARCETTVACGGGLQSTLPWAPFLLHWALQLGSQALAVCDYLGEHLANWFGVTAPKYRYEIEHGQASDDDNELKQEPGWQRPAELLQVTAQQPAQQQGPRY